MKIFSEFVLFIIKIIESWSEMEIYSLNTNSINHVENMNIA